MSAVLKRRRGETTKRLLISSLVALSCLFIPAVVPPLAHARWPFEADARMGLGFEDTYVLGEKVSTHRGVDIPSDAGDIVRAPATGIVSFVGAIPAGDDSAGETMLGVSLLLDDGRTLTLMPFARIMVSEGAPVDEGQVLGTLAVSGDRSSPSPHLHVGLKTGRLYHDPLAILGPIEISRPGGEEYGSDEVESEAFLSGGALIESASFEEGSWWSQAVIEPTAMPEAFTSTVTSSVSASVQTPASTASHPQAVSEQGLEGDIFSAFLVGLPGAVGCVAATRYLAKCISVSSRLLSKRPRRRIRVVWTGGLKRGGDGHAVPLPEGSLC